MRLQIFQSDKGDCLLLEGTESGRVLCDGGMSGSMKKHVRDELAKLRDQRKKIDYVYISHIDLDHIAGVLTLLDDELEWRLFDYHAANGNPIRRPKVPRPPEISGILHNAFRDQIGENAGDVEDMLAAASPLFLASAVPELVALGEELQQIALGIPEAVKVSRLASPGVLGIPINKLPRSKEDPPKLLMMRDRPVAFKVGSLKFTIIGPTAKELELLREGWQNFLRTAENRRKLRDLREELKRKIDGFGTEQVDLSKWSGVDDFKGVTVPNIASLMFIVEDGEHRLLLTGDSQQDIILNGLESAGFLKPDGNLHVDVLKVQHHGSEHNLDENFCRRITADNYVFCGNGSHGNPELSVIEMIFESRIGAGGRRGRVSNAVGGDFSFWFSTSSEMLTEGTEYRQRFEEVEALTKKLRAKANGRLSLYFNTAASILLDLTPS